MKTFIILVCSLALACSAGAAQNDNKSKKQAQKNRPRRVPSKSPYRMRRLDATRRLQIIPRRRNNGKVITRLPPHSNRTVRNTRHSVSIWRRTRVRRNTQLSTSSKAGASKAAKTGRVRITGRSGITDLRGTTGLGGGVITTTA